VILGCRNESSGLRARDEIAAETGNDDVHFRLLDLASLASVRRFADQFLRRKLPPAECTCSLIYMHELVWCRVVRRRLSRLFTARSVVRC